MMNQGRIANTQSDIEVFGDEQANDRQFVTALARGLELLRCFGPGEHQLSNAELARRAGIPKPTVSRLTHTLTTLGYLGYSESTGLYRLGSGVLALGYSLLAGLDVRQVARPLMQDLADYSRVSVALGMRDRLSMVYVENCRSSANVTLRLDVGSRIPVATTAMGRALICGLPEEQRATLLDELRRRDETAWPRVESGIRRAEEEYRERGFCLSIAEWESDIHAVGVSLRAGDGESTMALNCGGPAYLLNREQMIEDLGPRLVQLAKQLEGVLGRHDNGVLKRVS